MDISAAKGVAMAGRAGEKLGWIGGWIGAFLWVAILSIIFIVQGRPLAGAAGLLIVAAAAALVLLFAPWRHPRTAYWKLLLPAYAAVAASIAWAVVGFGVDALREEGTSPWAFGLVVQMLLPFLNAGGRRWDDGGR
jgi:hypothetical protein